MTTCITVLAISKWIKLLIIQTWGQLVDQVHLWKVNIYKKINLNTLISLNILYNNRISIKALHILKRLVSMPFSMVISTSLKCLRVLRNLSLTLTIFQLRVAVEVAISNRIVWSKMYLRLRHLMEMWFLLILEALTLTALWIKILALKHSNL